MSYICKKRKPNRRFRLRECYGDCLERLGIRNEGGGYVIIDGNARVRVGDVVHCNKVPGALETYLKQVKEINGNSIIVGTAYLDESKDYTFEAGEIMGVVIETYRKLWGFREYVRPKHSRKKDCAK